MSWDTLFCFSALIPSKGTYNFVTGILFISKGFERTTFKTVGAFVDQQACFPFGQHCNGDIPDGLMAALRGATPNESICLVVTVTCSS